MWWFWFSIVLIIIVLLFVGNLERSRVGRAWVAIREDEDAAEIMGVPTFKFKLWAFIIGAMIGGMSGALYAGQVQFVGADQLQRLQLWAVPLRRGAGRSGKQAGGDLGRIHHRSTCPTSSSARTELLGYPGDGQRLSREIKFSVFSTRADGADDLPAAGIDSGAVVAAHLRP